jgi:tryptophan-rich sensory protein
MGISLYLVWTAENTREKKNALLFFGFQLSLNALWSFLFFGLKAPWLAFAEIIVLWFAILLTIRAFLKISKNSAYLLVPYLLWVSFAALLNYSLAVLN